MSQLQNILNWLARHLQMTLELQGDASGVSERTLRRWASGETEVPQPLALSQYLGMLRATGHRLNPAAYLSGQEADLYWLEPGQGCTPGGWDVTLHLSGATKGYLMLFWRGSELVSVSVKEDTPYQLLENLYEDLADLAVGQVSIQAERYGQAA